MSVGGGGVVGVNSYVIHCTFVNSFPLFTDWSLRT